MNPLVLNGLASRNAAKALIDRAEDGMAVRIDKPKRKQEQSEKFHAICSDIAKSGFLWAGKPRTAQQWKVLLVSAHSIATQSGAEMVPGLENEFVNLRESTANMTKARASSLIEYALAFCHTNDIRLRINAEDLSH